jgi:hypothetical protein
VVVTVGKVLTILSFSLVHMLIDPSERKGPTIKMRLQVDLKDLFLGKVVEVKDISDFLFLFIFKKIDLIAVTFS